MTGSPIDGLGTDICRGIKKLFRKVFTGTFRCEICKQVTDKELKHEWGWKPYDVCLECYIQKNSK